MLVSLLKDTSHLLLIVTRYKIGYFVTDKNVNKSIIPGVPKIGENILPVYSKFKIEQKVHVICVEKYLLRGLRLH